MATTRAALQARLEALVVEDADAGRHLVTTPFDVKSQPNVVLDGSVRVTTTQRQATGRFGMTEDVVDEFTIWIARTHRADAHAAYLALETEMQSLRAAVIRDGCGAGDFAVVDGGIASIEHASDAPFSVGRLALPINYEVQL